MFFWITKEEWVSKKLDLFVCLAVKDVEENFDLLLLKRESKGSCQEFLSNFNSNILGKIR